METIHKEALFASACIVEIFEKLGAGARQRKAQAPWELRKILETIHKEALFASACIVEIFAGRGAGARHSTFKIYKFLSNKKEL